MTDFILLRNPAARPRSGSFNISTRIPGVHAGPSASTGDVVTFNPSFETLNSPSLNEIVEAGRDPDVAAITRAMPTTLIKPVAQSGAVPDAAGTTWGVSAVGADKSQFTGDGGIVAVLDTGIDASHSAFAGIDLVQEDFTRSSNGDRHGHGTHCAGTIFGRDVNGLRIGVAPGVKRALIGKVLGDDGRGTSAAMFDGIKWAFRSGANVVSMSLGFDFPGMVVDLEKQGWPLKAATSLALEAYRGNLRMFDTLMGLAQASGAFGPGSLVIAATGNESRRDGHPSFEIAASLPAAALDVVSVGALGQSTQGLQVAPFSNSFPTLSAPGVDVVSASVGGGLSTMSGTSMACPHVAGVACLWWEALQAEGGLPPSAKRIASRLVANARTDSLARGEDPADRGEGLAVAPA